MPFRHTKSRASYHKKRMMKNRYATARRATFVRTHPNMLSEPPVKFVESRSIGLPLSNPGGFAYGTVKFVSSSIIGNDLQDPMQELGTTDIPRIGQETKGYSAYRVLASRLNIVLAQKTGPQAFAYWGWILCRPSAETFTPPTTPEEMKNLLNVTYKEFRTSSGPTLGSYPCSLSIYCTLAKGDLNLPLNEILADPQFNGTLDAAGTPNSGPTSTKGWKFYYGVMGKTGFTADITSGDVHVKSSSMTHYYKVWNRDLNT